MCLTPKVFPYLALPLFLSTTFSGAPAALAACCHADTVYNCNFRNSGIILYFLFEYQLRTGVPVFETTQARSNRMTVRGREGCVGEAQGCLETEVKEKKERSSHHAIFDVDREYSSWHIKMDAKPYPIKQLIEKTHTNILGSGPGTWVVLSQAW